jgi:hypothetical protein
MKKIDRSSLLIQVDQVVYIHAEIGLALSIWHFAMKDR